MLCVTTFHGLIRESNAKCLGWSREYMSTALSRSMGTSKWICSKASDDSLSCVMLVRI